MTSQRALRRGSLLSSGVRPEDQRQPADSFHVTDRESPVQRRRASCQSPSIRAEGGPFYRHVKSRYPCDVLAPVGEFHLFVGFMRR